MKKKVTDFVKQLGGETTYSGNHRIMFCPEEMHEAILKEFGMGLPFKLGIS